MTLWTELAASGILLGGVYALAAVGFSLVWGVLNVLNLAQAAYLMFGAYIAYVAWTLGLHPVAGAITAVAIGAVVGGLVQVSVIDQTSKHGIFMTLVATFGVSLLLQNVVNSIFTGQFRSIDLSTDALFLGDARISVVRFQVFLVAVIAILGLQAFLSRTRLGLMIQATALDREGAQLVGINTRHIYLVTAAIAASSAALAGSLMGALVVITPAMGTLFIGKMFAIACLGGLGSIWSVLAAGIIFGLAETIGTALIGVDFQLVVTASVVLAVLLFRPLGIAGRRFFAEV